LFRLSGISRTGGAHVSYFSPRVLLSKDNRYVNLLEPASKSHSTRRFDEDLQANSKKPTETLVKVSTVCPSLRVLPSKNSLFRLDGPLDAFPSKARPQQNQPLQNQLQLTSHKMALATANCRLAYFMPNTLLRPRSGSSYRIHLVSSFLQCTF
jgi:hypothetical protein